MTRRYQDMKSVEEVEAMVLMMPSSIKDYPFGEDVAVYKIADSQKQTVDREGKSGKMFALISETAMPVRISLKCDPQLSELLREKYESVLPGYHLNKKHWNTIICSGQLEDDELKDLIRHSYELVTANS